MTVVLVIMLLPFFIEAIWKGGGVLSRYPFPCILEFPSTFKSHKMDLTSIPSRPFLIF